MRNTIYIGSLSDPVYTFDNDSSFSVSIEQNVALVGQTLSYDTLTITVADKYENLVDLYRFRSSDGQEIILGENSRYCIDVGDSLGVSDIIDLEYGTPVWYYREDVLVGRFFVNDTAREGKNLYRIECVSAIGILDKLQHGGGLFLASTFGTVLAHILAGGLHGTGSAVIDYEVDDDVAGLSVSGWLPYATKRENLYQLIFSYGVNIVKNMDGSPRFTFVYTAPDNPVSIAEQVVYSEGDVTYTKPYSGVSVSEHTYTAVTSEDPVTLLDNSTGTALSNEEIWFDQAPIIVSTLTASSGLTIVSATENSAVLSGNGVLTGIPYMHTVRRVTRTNSAVTGEKNIDVTGCTMVNAVNSNNLLNRLYAFFCPEDKIKLIRGSFKYTDERCGKAYTFKNAFGEDEVAYLSGMSLTVSSFVKADAEFYANYAPAGQAGLYGHVDILIPTWDEENEEWVYTGTWEVPEGVTDFKAVLIGGGTGGFSGLPGAAGEEADGYTDVDATADISGVWYGGEGGDGGAGGAGGSPGWVKTATFENVTAGDEYTFSLGQGGAGGGPTSGSSSVAGTAGTATTFSDGTDTISTADEDGYMPTGGVYEPITDQYFALTGNSGIPGGKGGARQVKNGAYFTWVTDGEDVVDRDGTVYRGGSTGTAMTSIFGLPEAVLTAYGGNGAGAAIGIDRGTQTGINGKSDQTVSWEVIVEEV